MQHRELEPYSGERRQAVSWWRPWKIPVLKTKDSNDSSFSSTSVFWQFRFSVLLLLVGRRWSQQCTVAAGCIDYRARTLRVWANLKATFSIKLSKCSCAAPGCGPRPGWRVKGVYSHYMAPSLSFPPQLLDNCNLPQSASANRWPWRPTGRSCSLSMSSLSQIHAAFILCTVCGGAAVFCLHFIQLSLIMFATDILRSQVKHSNCVNHTNVSLRWSFDKFGTKSFFEFRSVSVHFYIFNSDVICMKQMEMNTDVFSWPIKVDDIIISSISWPISLY